ncbi:hypothetical protein CEF21_21100 [Bacillus sp. FJAT-42376]|uniref:hypothetical protein n=1 Tax=Bacillus sp. FJAT-42376 TaxID=2014076 RepID=UPI000F4D83BB|nr:hypothetical protein [Bacillus sp. FJAT-42376]AZB44581.1 hypothetical protein CEF21_21100 [Bacillus sp. FJAT-42376]
MNFLKTMFTVLVLIMFSAAQIFMPIKVSAEVSDTNEVIELTGESGITHIPTETGFTTFVDRNKLPESIRSFVKISVGSSNGQMIVNRDNIDDYIGGFYAYDDRGYNSGLPSKGKYYNLTILYSKENQPLAYYTSSVNYEGTDEGNSEEGLDSIVLSEESLTVLPGKTVKIHVYSIDKDGTEKDITNNKNTVYRSSSTTVASVKQGKIKAGSKEGKAVITVSFKGKKVTLPVSVSKAGVQKLTASVKELDIETGETASIDLFATLSNNTKKDVTAKAAWTTEDSEVAEVDGGEIEGVSSGETTITAFYQGYEVIIKVNVTDAEEENKEVESLQITDKNVKMLVNEEKILKVFATYTDGSREDVSDQVTMTSSKSSVAEIEDSILTANSIGKSTITASYEGEETSIKVEVIKDKKVKSLKASAAKVTLKREAEEGITLTAYYYDGTKRNVTTMADWKVTKSGIVTVEDGVIKAGKKKGTTTITAKYNDRSVNIPVTVN